MTLKDACTYLAAASGVIAGVAWLVSTWVGVAAPKRDPPIEGPTADGAITARFGRHYLLLLPTLRRQSAWNSYAAVAASISAFAQVALLFL